MSKSDPMCVTYTKPFGHNDWVQIHQTECVVNCHDPDFVSKIQMVYRFEQQQPMMFEIYDVDTKNIACLSDHDFLGRATCTLGQIVSSSTKPFSLSLVDRDGRDSGKSGKIILHAEEVIESKNEIVLQFSGVGLLKRKFFFRKRNPFLIVSKYVESDYVATYQTEVIRDTYDPNWKKFSVPISSFCNGDEDRTIKIVCSDWRSDGNHVFLGEFHTTLGELRETWESGGKRGFVLTKPKKTKKSNRKCGRIFLDYYEKRPIYTFLDYINGGTQIHCSVAIDFTCE